MSSLRVVRTYGASRRTGPVAKNFIGRQTPVLRSRMPSENMKSQPAVISIVTLRPISPSPPLCHSPGAPHFFCLGTPGKSTGDTLTTRSFGSPGFTYFVTSTGVRANIPAVTAARVPFR